MEERVRTEVRVRVRTEERVRVGLGWRRTYSVEVGVRVFRHVVVEDDVDPLDVHAPPKQVGGHQDASLEVLKLLVAREPAGGGVRKGEELGRGRS